MPVAGLMALFGAMVGAGPVSAESAIGCFTVGIGMFIIHGRVVGLAQLPQPLVPVRQLPPPHVSAHARVLSPFLAISIPAPVSRPIFIRSRRLVNPAFTNSCRFLKALYISFHRARETFSPFLLKYIQGSCLRLTQLKLRAGTRMRSFRGDCSGDKNYTWLKGSGSLRQGRLERWCAARFDTHQSAPSQPWLPPLVIDP